MAKIVYFTADKGACMWYRCKTPGDELIKRGHEVTITEPIRRSLVDWADVVVFQRRHEHEVLDAIEDARSKGKLTIYELDDDIWNIHRESPAFSFFDNQAIRTGIENSIRACDMATVTTKTLVNRINSLNRNISILPNMLPDSFWPNTPKSQSYDEIVIGWAGSDTHYADLALLRDLIGQVLDRHKNVRFVTAGMNKLPFRKHPKMSTTYLQGGLEHYSDLLSGFDIALAPLEDTMFNAAKSDLKYLEYAAVGIPIIASKVPSYQESIENGETGFLASNPKDWMKYLTRLIQNTDLRARMGARAQKVSKTRFISRNIELWERAYQLDAVGIVA